MSIRYLLDTNIVIFALRRGAPELRDRLARESARLATSTITAMELEYGAAKSSDAARNRAATSRMLALVEILPFDRRAAEHAGEIRADLARQGTPIGGYDVLIAGAARSAGLILVTNNTREFERVPGLQLEDWTRAA